jgi:toxin ParE1/3/4
MMPVIFSPEAEADLREIGDYIAQDNPRRAASFAQELFEHALRITDTPYAYPKRDDLSAGLMMAVHGSYLILFRIKGGHVEIARILHGARDLKRIFKT